MPGGGPEDAGGGGDTSAAAVNAARARSAVRLSSVVPSCVAVLSRPVKPRSHRDGDADRPGRASAGVAAPSPLLASCVPHGLPEDSSGASTSSRRLPGDSSGASTSSHTLPEASSGASSWARLSCAVPSAPATGRGVSSPISSGPGGPRSPSTSSAATARSRAARSSTSVRYSTTSSMGSAAALIIATSSFWVILVASRSPNRSTASPGTSPARSAAPPASVAVTTTGALPRTTRPNPSGPRASSTVLAPGVAAEASASAGVLVRCPLSLLSGFAGGSAVHVIAGFGCGRRCFPRISTQPPFASSGRVAVLATNSLQCSRPIRGPTRHAPSQ